MTRPEVTLPHFTDVTPSPPAPQCHRAPCQPGWGMGQGPPCCLPCRRRAEGVHPPSPSSPSLPAPPLEALGHLSLRAPPQTGLLKINMGADHFPQSSVWEPSERSKNTSGPIVRPCAEPRRPWLPLELLYKGHFRDSSSPSYFNFLRLQTEDGKCTQGWWYEAQTRL